MAPSTGCPGLRANHICNCCGVDDHPYQPSSKKMSDYGTACPVENLGKRKQLTQPRTVSASCVRKGPTLGAMQDLPVRQHWTLAPEKKVNKTYVAGFVCPSSINIHDQTWPAIYARLDTLLLCSLRLLRSFPKDECKRSWQPLKASTLKWPLCLFCYAHGEYRPSCWAILSSLRDSRKAASSSSQIFMQGV